MKLFGKKEPEVVSRREFEDVDRRLSEVEKRIEKYKKAFKIDIDAEVETTVEVANEQ